MHIYSSFYSRPLLLLLPLLGVVSMSLLVPVGKAYAAVVASIASSTVLHAADGILL